MVILGFTIIVDYYAGIFIEQSEGNQRKWFLVMSLIANIGVLAVFKYYNFINENITWLLKGFALQNPIHLFKYFYRLVYHFILFRQ
jgi:ribosomal protein L19